MKDKVANEFQEFWNHTSEKVGAYMFCACRNSTDAEDMVQDCCLRALKAWNQFNGKGSRQAWLFGIARRTHVDWLRRQKSEITKVNSKMQERQNESIPEDSTFINSDKIWDIVKNLNQEQSEVIHLKFAAGLSYLQIANILEIPVGTVRSRLHRGLKVIKKNVGELENGS
ncbi:MAG: RNA polymerase sigma factor [Sedimentisphaerales bacterium]|nr:RNA polymerase sigma factor [Sedimentisphaerales bacterium]